MTRYYLITWYPNKSKTERTNKITIAKPTGIVGRDAQTAVNLFIANFGNLKQNTIVKIKEFDENDNQIGEDITPISDAIIPIGR